MAALTGSTEPSQQGVVDARLRRMLVSNHCALPLNLFHLLFASLLALMIWDEGASLALHGWVALAVGLSLLDLATRALLRRASTDYAVWPVLALDTAIGLLWLYAGIVLFPTGLVELQFFFLFSIGASALCTAVYQHFWLPACFLRIGAALPAASVQVLSTDVPFASVRSLIVLAVWIAILWLAFRLHQSLLHRLQLTVTRDALLRQVEHSARQLDVLRKDEVRSRAEAEQANLAKSRFLAHSSHDLRQPLHAIRLLLETVDDSELDPSSVHVIDRVRQSTDALGKLFDSLLDLTLLDTGQMEVNPRRVSVRDLLAEVADDFAELARANEVTLSVEAEACLIAADPTILRRMVQNLVANAIRHTPGGRVTLRAPRDGDEVWLSVHDTGSGIAPEDQDSIFEEFTRITDGSGQMTGDRLGLGLSIVSRLARLTSVGVKLESALGQGSRFTIGPFEAIEGVAAAASGADRAASSLEGKQVVVVDDDRDTLEATGRLLRKWGLTVRLADSAAAVDARDADILVCDVELGSGPDGIDVVKAAWDSTGSRVKALLISGNTSTA